MGHAVSVLLFINPGQLVGPVVASVKTIAAAQSPYTVGAADSIIEATTAAGAITVNLPAAAAAKRVLWIKKTTNDNNTVTIAPAGADTIEGAAASVVEPGGALTALQLVSDGVSNWSVL